MKIRNVSSQVLGIMVSGLDGSSHQVNLLVGESMKIDEVTTQIVKLCDPSKRLLILMKED